MNNKLTALFSGMIATSLVTGAFAFAQPLTTPVPADAAPVTVQSVTFNGSKAPVLLDERTKPFTNASIDVTYSNGFTKNFPLSYKTLFYSNQEKNGVAAGLVIDAKGNPVMDTSIPEKPVPFISDGPDANTLLQIGGLKDSPLGGHSLAMVTHYEYTSLNAKGGSAYGITPGSHGLSFIDQNRKTGELTATDWRKIDMSPVFGSWIPCAGSKSPWNTHLGSEEYEPDARDAESATPKDKRLASYTELYFGKGTKPNPYLYGYITEIVVQPDGKTRVYKHFSMGRTSTELARVMPDHRTAFIGDDGAYNILPMYIADKPNDLTSGTLYAAKFTQTTDQNGGAGTLAWIKLGHATNNEVLELAFKTKFSDIFETANADTPGFRKVRVYPTGKDEWLKLKPGMEKAAAFLETHRYAALLGATTEWNKYEGVAVNAKDKKVYLAMASVDKSMLAETGAPADDIRFPKVKAGAVYEMPLTGGQKDTSGNPIDSEYVGVSVKAIVSGEDLAKPDAAGNTANNDKIANPDNLDYSESMRTLLIGEDSGMHLNNYVWAYEIDKNKLSRILSVPAGGEATGLQMIDQLNGFSYIMANTQHPGDIADYTNTPAELKFALGKRIDAKAGVIGYVSGLPNLNETLVADQQYLPLKDLIKHFGLKLNFSKKDKQYNLSGNGVSVSFKPGSKMIQQPAGKAVLKQAILMKNGSLMVPAELIHRYWNVQLVNGKDGLRHESKR